jgi:hypothetical protein
MMRVRVGVHAHIPDVRAESALERLGDVSIERMTGRARECCAAGVDGDAAEVSVVALRDCGRGVSGDRSPVATRGVGGDV